MKRIIFLLAAVSLLGGCTTLEQLTRNACNHKAKIQEVIDAAQAAINQCPIGEGIY